MFLVDLIHSTTWSRPTSGRWRRRPAGRVRGAVRHRDEGLASNVGVTGHGLRIAGMHLRTIERHDVASVLLPVNFVLLDRPDYRANVERVLEVCTEHGIAIQTIKSIAKGRWHDGIDRHFSWYRPLTDPAAIARAVRYVLAEPRLFLNTTSDAHLLPPIIDAACGDLDQPTTRTTTPTSSTTASPRSSTTSPSNALSCCLGSGRAEQVTGQVASSFARGLTPSCRHPRRVDGVLRCGDAC